MNGILLLIAIFLIAIIITFVVLCCYIKLLSILAGRLRQALNKVSEARSDARKESSIEVCCIYCFDSTYDFLNSHIFRRIGRVIKYFIRHKPISNNRCNGYDECSCEYHNTDFKSSLPEHRSSITPYQPNANKTKL